MIRYKNSCQYSHAGTEVVSRRSTNCLVNDKISEDVVLPISSFECHVAILPITEEKHMKLGGIY